MATSTYRGPYSIAWAMRPVFSAASRIVPEPANWSSTRSPRAVQSRIASATRAIGLTVGWADSASIRPGAKVFAPAYDQRFERLRPKRPSRGNGEQRVTTKSFRGDGTDPAELE